jgi:hypothetical protein
VPFLQVIAVEDEATRKAAGELIGEYLRWTASAMDRYRSSALFMELRL